MNIDNYPPVEVIDLARKIRKEVVRLARRSYGRSETLEGYCAIASNALNCVLKAYGYSPKIVYAELLDGGPHCWIELNGWAIDITATQFPGNYPKVYITNYLDDELYHYCEYIEPESSWITDEEWEEYVCEWEVELFERFYPKDRCA